MLLGMIEIWQKELISNGAHCAPLRKERNLKFNSYQKERFHNKVINCKSVKE